MEKPKTYTEQELQEFTASFVKKFIVRMATFIVARAIILYGPERAANMQEGFLKDVEEVLVGMTREADATK